MVCSFEDLLWHSVLFICYSRLSFSFVDSFIVMDEYDAIFVFTFTVFLRIRGVGTAILDDYKWSLFSGICRRMKKVQLLSLMNAGRRK